MSDYRGGPEALDAVIADMSEPQVRAALRALMVKHVRWWNRDYTEPNLLPGEAEAIAARLLTTENQRSTATNIINYVAANGPATGGSLSSETRILSTSDRERVSRDSESRSVCPYCHGHGRDPMSDNVNWLPCPTCHGTGKKEDAR